MTSASSEAIARLALCSRELKARSLRREAEACQAQVAQLGPAELASEAIRAGACLNVALDKLGIAVREMRYADAEEEMQRALSFAAWVSACQAAATHQRLALAA